MHIPGALLLSGPYLEHLQGAMVFLLVLAGMVVAGPVVQVVLGVFERPQSRRLTRRAGE